MLEINHIRKRPGMYIVTLGNGSHESHGIYNLLKIVFFSLVRQFRAGITDEIAITIQDDRSVTICYPSTDIEYIEIIEALSCSYEIVTENGFTRLSFTPDETIFEEFSFREHIVFHLLRSYCHANRGLIIRYDGTKLAAPDGLLDLAMEKMSSPNGYLYPVINLQGKGFEIAFTHNKYSEAETYYSFVNGIKTEGGSHLEALKEAVVRIIAETFPENDFTTEDILKGIFLTISVDIVEPVFSQSCRGVLVSSRVSPDGPELTDFIYESISAELSAYFEANPETVKQLQACISRSKGNRLQLEKYLSITPQELVDIWNDTEHPSSIGTRWLIIDAFLAKGIKTISIQRSGAHLNGSRISYDEENNRIQC